MPPAFGVEEQEMSVATMAKKKTEKPQSPPKREEVVAFRCTSEFKSHLEAIAELETRTPTQVIVRALQQYAEANKYDPFPKR